jgi:hypothetical protein
MYGGIYIVQKKFEHSLLHWLIPRKHQLQIPEMTSAMLTI